MWVGRWVSGWVGVVYVPVWTAQTTVTGPNNCVTHPPDCILPPPLSFLPQRIFKCFFLFNFLGGGEGRLNCPVAFSSHRISLFALYLVTHGLRYLFPCGWLWFICLPPSTVGLPLDLWLGVGGLVVGTSRCVVVCLWVLFWFFLWMLWFGCGCLWFVLSLIVDVRVACVLLLINVCFLVFSYPVCTCVHRCVCLLTLCNVAYVLRACACLLCVWIFVEESFFFLACLASFPLPVCACLLLCGTLKDKQLLYIALRSVTSRFDSLLLVCVCYLLAYMLGVCGYIDLECLSCIVLVFFLKRIKMYVCIVFVFTLVFPLFNYDFES